ncbi:hypothetical protein HAX54_018864 [Datura stramonium]|uniref:Sec23/Sec24 beta-sandwich domain-containing protein n=1 Tax=Datura stramonium TaxID=4076 RepID=A0ABS8RJW3_DATST|nr:hypothetical protein [Datura stramonium]
MCDHEKVLAGESPMQPRIGNDDTVGIDNTRWFDPLSGEHQALIHSLMNSTCLVYQNGIFEVNCSKDMKVQGVIGPCASLEKKGPLCSEVVVGQGNTTAWKMCGLDKTTTFCLIFEVAKKESPDAIAQSANPQFYFQFLTYYQHPSGQMRLRVTTLSRRWVAGSGSVQARIFYALYTLIGITVTGLEPEFQPIVNYLLPHIISSKQDANDMHLQLLQHITNRLGMFLPQLEADLNCFSEAAEYATRFLAMLAGPLYPILQIVKERTLLFGGVLARFTKLLLSSLVMMIGVALANRKGKVW